MIPNAAKDLTMMQSLISRVSTFVGLGANEEEAPIAFTYSLFYVYYD